MPKIILRQTEPPAGEQVLYTYPYDSFNTGQDVSYATGDDKWVRDNVFIPEINSWDTSLKWVFPVLSQTDPTKLLRGSNPDGSGTNIFGNLERFTDTLGNRWNENVTDYIIDHYCGVSMYTDRTVLQRLDFINQVSAINNLNAKGYSDYHLPNIQELQNVFNNYINPRLFLTNTQNIGGIQTSTTYSIDTSSYYIFLSLDRTYLNFEKSILSNPIAFRKAFTYNPTTKQMELS